MYIYIYIHKLCKTCKSVNPTRIRVILDHHKDTSLDITSHFWIPKLPDAPRCTGASKSPVPLLPLLPLLPWPRTFAARWNSSLEIGRDLLMTRIYFYIYIYTYILYIYIYIIHLFIDLSSSNSRVIMYIYIYHIIHLFIDLSSSNSRVIMYIYIYILY